MSENWKDLLIVVVCFLMFLVLLRYGKYMWLGFYLCFKFLSFVVQNTPCYPG
jgi:hypothetical protein